MFFLDLTLPSPEENLALDEALLDLCEAGFRGEILRFWEPRRIFVVLGYSNGWEREVNHLQCRSENVPILRRPSGGGTVLQGPGCLNYALILNTHSRKSLRNVQSTNNFILNKIRRALQPLTNEKIQIRGLTDLAIQEKKFSGNAQRRRLHYLLFHGTILTQFNAKSIQKFLPFPSKSPAYRGSRSHMEFLTNFRAPVTRIKAALKKVWGASENLPGLPTADVQRLIREKYSQKDWNFRF